jgi:cysteine desulfurase
MREVYVDNNATTKVDEAVFEEMRPYFCELYGNPSSMHFFGGQVQKKIDEARKRTAALLGALPEEIIFTACGTESNNSAIRSALEIFPEKRHIVTTRVEHPAVLTPCRNLSKRGYRITELSVDGNGNLDLDELRTVVDEDTAIVSIMYANNETGVVFPIEEIGAIVKEKGALFHTDAVQAVGKIPMNMANSTVDMLSLSGHKLHAPKGIGALYIRKGVPFRPFMVGGHQERSRRAGTENSAGIIALGKACELAGEFLNEENTTVKTLRDRLEAEILRLVSNVRVNGGGAVRLPNTTSVAFEFVEGEAIVPLREVPVLPVHWSPHMSSVPWGYPLPVPMGRYAFLSPVFRPRITSILSSRSFLPLFRDSEKCRHLAGNFCRTNDGCHVTA